ncbi:peptidase [Desulfobacter hydrogenophilus]|uniref:Peptidase n=1 Tax=Desulfobacter hydrogenophilus TaxID=2291 RepID=A0A328FCG0_9BACT|nr:S26 family signal peptidase [Desulfobacter hydrogenophilus]NDY73518.1 peptidase [Desulfobacter hydrogenophilus]QBH15697.1 peptidase [Desulfobacter hydrogenophilus]RAM00727.1 peptidase [Desulfobacter hydrogenophilus]
MKHLLFVISLTAIVILFISNYCYINATASLPVGLYLKTNQPIKIGSIVVFYPDLNENPFAAKYVSPGIPLMKRVAFLSGQTFHLPPASNIDSKGRTITPFSPKTGIVPSEQLVVVGNTKYSLDSRYLGFIPQSSIIDTVSPLFVF